MSSLSEFCSDLLVSGQTIVTSQTWQPDAEEAERTILLLKDVDAEYRLSLPGIAAPLQGIALLWSARAIAWSASMLLDRDAGDVVLPAELANEPLERNDPSAIQSVDLMLRFLPSLASRASRIDRDDPLLSTFVTLGRLWPLSSVGMQDIVTSEASVDIDTILQHDCLRGLYIDRVISEQDRSRISDPRVQQAIAIAVGDHVDLAGKLLRDDLHLLPCNSQLPQGEPL